MAKRVNYGYAKRQKEIKRERKKAEKAAKKLLKMKQAAQSDGSEVDSVEDDGASDRGLPSADDHGSTRD